MLSKGSCQHAFRCPEKYYDFTPGRSFLHSVGATKAARLHTYVQIFSANLPDVLLAPGRHTLELVGISCS